MSSPMRTASATITYNGEDISIRLDKKTGSFSYNDPESGSSDDCSLIIIDPYDEWINEKFPHTGDTIIATIKVYNWRHAGDNRVLRCGTFVIDDPGFSGPPTKVSFKGVSKPAEEGFSATTRTQTWENVTVQNMVQEIASRNGITLRYEADEVSIDSLEQSDQTDSDFLKKVCDDYGLSVKIYSNSIIIFDREAYKKRPPAMVIDKGMMTSWDFKTTLAGTYTGGKMKYTDADSGEDIEATVGSDKRLLSVNGKADNQADAEKQIKAAVNKANDEETTLSVKIPGEPDIVSSQVIAITGLGVADGNYYVKKVSHTIGSKYETSLELSKIQESI